MSSNPEEPPLQENLEIIQLPEAVDDNAAISKEENALQQETPTLLVPPESRYSHRKRVSKTYSYFILYQTICNVEEPEEPKTVNEASSEKYNSEWKAAMKSEFYSLMENHTYELVNKANNKNIIKSKWVLKLNLDANREQIDSKQSLLLKALHKSME